MSEKIFVTKSFKVMFYRRVSLPCSILSVHHFLSALKIVRRSPDSHDKLIYMDFFNDAYKTNQV